MTFKTLEIRDEGTHIAILAMRMQAENVTQAYYIHHRAGHPVEGRSIVVMRLDDMRATNDPYEWKSLVGSERTMPTAHDHIIDHFDELSDGDVVDVQFILGETTEKKISERFVAA